MQGKNLTLGGKKSLYSVILKIKHTLTVAFPPLANHMAKSYSSSHHVYSNSTKITTYKKVATSMSKGGKTEVTFH